MNRFLSRKKTKDGADLDQVDFPEGQSSNPSLMSRGFKRKQKNTVEPETKPEFDLSSALPATNDFRTSLLMPGLSARFSMLREQDDPSTKIGKANDDSVLFPKRQSRLNVFQSNELTDIAEVESIYSVRPPFAEFGRVDSYEGYASDDGNIMNRTRPKDSNNLFGGRQKIYRIPTGGSSSKSLGDKDGGKVGRHTYDDDVPLSSIQQYRMKQKEDLLRQEGVQRPSSLETVEADDGDPINSPTESFSKNRGTTSSTTSGPSNGRSSTAATSIASESPLMHNTSTGQVGTKIGPLDRDSINTQSSSNDKRKLSNTSSEKISLPPVPATRDVNYLSLADKPSPRSPVFTTGTYRPLSPPTTSNNGGLAGLDFGLKENTDRPSPQDGRKYQTAPPTQNLANGSDEDLYALKVQPIDRHKATAMGLFNRPQASFDERKFSERQMQMHEGRNSPSDNRREDTPSPEPANASLRSPETSQSTVRSPLSQTITTANSQNSVSSPSLGNSITTKTDKHPRVRSTSTTSSSATASANVKARLESLIRKQNAELEAWENQAYSSANAKGKARQQSIMSNETSSTSQEESRKNSNQFNDESDDDDDSSGSARKESVTSPPIREVHPAFRSGPHGFDFGEGVTSAGSKSPPTTLFTESNQPVKRDHFTTRDPIASVASSKSIDTLPTGAGLGLSNLIRTHMRNDSDKSSLMPPSPMLVQGPINNLTREVSVASTAQTINPPESTRSDPWELDSASKTEENPIDSLPAEAAPISMLQRAQMALEQAKLRQAQTNAEEEATERMGESLPARSWQDEMAASHHNHHRAESTETTREDRAFDQELAERRKRIEHQMRSRSPPRQASGMPVPAFRPTGREPVNMGSNLSQKSMRGWGFGGSPNYPEQIRQGMHRPSQPTPPEFGNNGRRTPTSGQPGQRSTTPTSGRVRDRANSEARSRSRTGRNRPEDIYRSPDVMPQRQSPSKSPPHGPPNSSKGPSESRHSDHMINAPSGRDRSLSRPNIPGSFERSPMMSPPDMPAFGAPRPSPKPGIHSPMGGWQPPVAVSSQTSLTALPSPQPPLSGRQSPPTNNGRTTPIASTASTTSNRKKSVTKGMISEPTFISSTSSVPLVGLPPNNSRNLASPSPPIPAMNPRRRGNTTAVDPINSTNNPFSTFQNNLSSPRLNVSSPMPAPAMPSQSQGAFPNTSPAPEHISLPAKSSQRQRNRLRKTSSEGGNMAAKARQQAVLAELGKSQASSPAVPIFPNRSATSLPQPSPDGGMF